MTDSELHIQTQKNMLALFRYTMRLHCRHETTKTMLVAIYQQKGVDAAKLLQGMEMQANKMLEDILLQIGDSNPQGADLLDVSEFLRKFQ